LFLGLIVVDKRERKLAGLLVEGNISEHCKGTWNEFIRVRYRLLRLRENRPEVYTCLIAKYNGVLDEIKRAIG
jgi:hypothetical protein